MPEDRAVIDLAGLQTLLHVLRDHGYTVVGPTVRDDAIVYDEIHGLGDLPRGWGDEQDGGTYRLRRREDEALFGYAVGPHSWKKYLFPSHTLLWRARRTADGFSTEAPEPDEARYAFLGVRGCELAAIQVQDRVFLGAHADPGYGVRREAAFLIAVHCGEPAGTCFCVSMGTGPSAGPGFDLALTEVIGSDGHFFVVDRGSDRGAEVLRSVAFRDAGSGECRAADAVVTAAAERMGREMDTGGIKELLYANYEHPRWDEVAQRCLACGNCTMACPTCFCSTVEDTTDLTGQHSEHHRVWDSCFTLDFSELGGHHVRGSTRARYRQWMTHKLATWIDQFGTSGCVGCGRCITWCPVGIDITEEVAAIRDQQDSRDHGNA